MISLALTDLVGMSTSSCALNIWEKSIFLKDDFFSYSSWVRVPKNKSLVVQTRLFDTGVAY